jgi:hypothetical protein
MNVIKTRSLAPGNISMDIEKYIFDHIVNFHARE